MISGLNGIGRRRALGVALFVAVYLVWTGIGLLVDRSVDGAEPETPALALFGLAILLLIVGTGAAAVLWMRRGLWAMGTTVGLVAVVIVVLGAGESFTIAEAEQCGCDVGRRHGTAEATWLAFDTVPILKINDTLGWEEPQPLSAVAPTGSVSDIPVRRWVPALAVRFAVGFILLAIAKGLFDLMRGPIRSKATTARADRHDIH